MTCRNTFLLNTYFKQGWLARRYFNGKVFCQPYSAEDRLLAGERFYEDYVCWAGQQKLICDYERQHVDGTPVCFGFSVEAERFRRALRKISKGNLPVVYKIVLEEKPVAMPKGVCGRERLYFNDEIKGLLCRGLDELCRFYAS